MFESLSKHQRKVVECDASRIVVKACPGSGKTFSVAARLAKLLTANQLQRHQGIAALSFTNTACDEIRKGLRDNFKVAEIGYPNFVGTIDSFVNNYIFLPFGHLEMKCQQRPEIVGTEYNKWHEYDYSKTIKRKVKSKDKWIEIVADRDPSFYFDKVSFDKNDTLISIMSATSYHFSWNPEKHYTRSGQMDEKYRKIFKSIKESKRHHFSQCKANQSDANYIAYKILNNYPQIATNIVERFPILIIDEAQDTTDLQMAIIDILDNAGMKCIMLIGDPDQAIFEWNTADPSLFMEKYNSPKWQSIDLTENRRSSTNICNVINNFFGAKMESISRDKDCAEVVDIKGHKTTPESINAITKLFIEKCEKLQIAQKDIAVVYRGRSFGEKYFKLVDESSNHDDLPWENGNYHVRDIVQGKYFIDSGNYKKGFQLIEKGYHKMSNNTSYVPSHLIKNKINELGFREYRQNLFEFIESLSSTADQTLGSWVSSAKIDKSKLRIKASKSGLLIKYIFHDDKKENSDVSYLKTIHSVKGMSLEAILVFLQKKSALKDYKTILSPEYAEDDENKRKKDEEEMRIVYVACSRPKKILWLAVPEDDVDCWVAKLFSENR